MDNGELCMLSMPMCADGLVSYLALKTKIFDLMLELNVVHWSRGGFSILPELLSVQPLGSLNWLLPNGYEIEGWITSALQSLVCRFGLLKGFFFFFNTELWADFLAVGALALAARSAGDKHGIWKNCSDTAGLMEAHNREPWH